MYSTGFRYVQTSLNIGPLQFICNPCLPRCGPYRHSQSHGSGVAAYRLSALLGYWRDARPSERIKSGPRHTTAPIGMNPTNLRGLPGVRPRCVDHAAGGHKSAVWLSHNTSLPVQTSRQHARIHAAHHHDPATCHLHFIDTDGTDRHTHFTLASFRRVDSTLFPLLYVLINCLALLGNASVESSPFCDEPFSSPPRSRPLYLHSCTLLI